MHFKHSCEGYRSNHFVIGLTDVSPTVTAPTLWNYAVCRQYPTTVAEGATVTMRCTSKHVYYPPHLCRVYSPAVYLAHVSVQIRHRTVSDDRLRKFLRTGGLRSL